MRQTLFVFLFIILLNGCTSQDISSVPKRIKHKDNGAMMVSVSSDGNYAVSSHLNGELVLWDIRSKTNKIITDNANIYSAYFIKNSDKFMWQEDTSNEVYVEDIAGKKWLSFQPGFPTYGQVMSNDLKHYFASDEDWNLFSGYGRNENLIMRDWGGFLGGFKLLNLTLSNKDKLLLTSGIGGDNDDTNEIIHGKNSVDGNAYMLSKQSNVDGVMLWDVKTGQPLHKLVGNGAKTIATLSPDGKYVVGGDEGSGALIWNAHTGKKHLDVSQTFYNMPRDFVDFQLPANDPPKSNSTNGAVFALKFITDKEYLRFTTSVNYAILYNVNNPCPLKYLRFTPQPLALNGDFMHNEAILGKGHLPSVNGDYSRDATIDTAPKAHILVTGQDVTDGINVYQYDPKAKTLAEIWHASMHDTETK